MAEASVYRTQLRLNFQDGVDPDSGKVIIKTKSFNNILVNADTDALYAVGSALAELQSLPLQGIERIDSAELYSDE